MTTPFAVTVSPFQAMDLFGLCVATDMEKAAVDCPNIWQQGFMPRSGEFFGASGPAFQGYTYGISVMTDENAGGFDYWAAIPTQPEATLPAGTRRISLPAGLYAGCRVPSLAQIGEAYDFLCRTWVSAQAEYTPRLSAPSFERYGDAFMRDGSFEIFIPVDRI